MVNDNMVLKYMKFKYTVFYKRFKKENNKEERIGVIIGYILIMGLVFGIAYLVYHFLFNENDKLISTTIFLLYFLLTIIAAFSLFDKVHNIFFKNKDREILFLLPCKIIDIIIIRYIELLLGFLESFLLIFFPAAAAYLIINSQFIINFIFLLISSFAIGIFMVSFVIFVVILTSNITKGKNTKGLSVGLSVIFTAIMYYIAIFLSEDLDKLLGTNKILIVTVFFPFIKISNVILADNVSNLMINILLCYIYVIPIFIATILYFSYSIKHGFLYYQDENRSKSGWIKSFMKSPIGMKMCLWKGRKDVFVQSIKSIVEKDLISLINTYDILKIVAQILIIAVILTVRFDLKKDGVGIWIIILTKTVLLVFLSSYYIYEYEKKKLQILILSGIPNYIIVISKYNVLNIINILWILIMDICLFTINHSTIFFAITGCTLDIICILAVNLIACIVNFWGLNMNEKTAFITSKYKVLNFFMISLVIYGIGSMYFGIRSIYIGDKINIIIYFLGIFLLYIMIWIIEKKVWNICIGKLKHKQVSLISEEE